MRLFAPGSVASKSKIEWWCPMRANRRGCTLVPRALCQDKGGVGPLSPHPRCRLGRRNDESVAAGFPDRLDAVNDITDNHGAQSFELVLFLHPHHLLHGKREGLLLEEQSGAIVGRVG